MKLFCRDCVSSRNIKSRKFISSNFSTVQKGRPFTEEIKKGRKLKENKSERKIKLCRQRLRRINCLNCHKAFDSEEEHQKYVNMREVKKYYCHHHDTCTEMFTKHELLKHCKQHNISIGDSTIYFGRALKKTFKTKPKIEESCEICFDLFETKDALTDHIKSHSDQHKCPKCGSGFKEIIDYISHLTSHEAEDIQLKCPECGFKASCRRKMKFHLKCHDIYKRYKCKICGKKYPTYRPYIDHIKYEHNKEEPLKCDECDETFLSQANLKHHKFSRHDFVKKFKESECSLCRIKFPTYGSMKRHLAVHNLNRCFVCDFCGMKCTDSGAFRTHLRRHTGDKPYKCSFCEKKFISQNIKRSHERLHTGEKPYECPYCEKKFTQRSPMVIHCRIHTGERPYICLICNKGFIAKNRLQSHLKGCKGS